MYLNLLKYYYTLKYLKPIQIYGQLVFRLRKLKTKQRVDTNFTVVQRETKSNWKTSISKSCRIISPNRAIFLNQERDISEKNIWNDPSIDKLWLYNLHYFDFLHAEGAKEIMESHGVLVKRWITENPPANGCGWEAYTISLRIVNWIKWILTENVHDPEIMPSLAIQARFLSKRLEIHLLANHLFANAKALLFAGLFFEGVEADGWFERGLKVFERELSEQILSDGGHIELSPMYHSIILEDVLDVINLFKTYGKMISPAWLNVCDSMFYWLRNMCHPDGDLSFFNDSTLGVVPTLQELEKYQERLLIHNNIITSTERLIYLSDSGYCRIQHSNMLLLADVAEIGASYQPGHAHADTLSFELSIRKQRLIVNSGISSYSDNIERLRQRGTKAHNTVVVDDKNSSEIWKSFRVAYRAGVHDIEFRESNEEILLKASHNGYKRVNKIIHTRTWRVIENKLFIQDCVSGTKYHEVELTFYIHPNVKLEQKDDKKVVFYDQVNQFIACFQAQNNLSIVDSTYHPSFNVSIPNKKIVVKVRQRLPVFLSSSITWN